MSFLFFVFKKKPPHRNKLEQLRHKVAINPALVVVAHKQEGTHNSQLLPKE